MKTSRYVLAATLLVLSAAGVLASAQGEKVAPTRGVTQTTKLETYTGKSINGNLQEALNDALTQAHTAVNKNGADMQFNWQMGACTGTRGGITGSQLVNVTIQIVK